MDLLERAEHIEALDGALADVIGGHGRVVLISGEPGIGKTSVIRAFIARHQGTGGDQVRVLGGICDDLSTPRALGPLHDMASYVGTELAGALRSGAPPDQLFGLVLAELRQPPTPVVMVIEDVHWADDATLDLLIFLARRLDVAPALLLLTYRSEELDGAHRLLRALGRIPSHLAVRVQLRPLSLAALEELAGPAAAELYRLTGGNPFYVSEALAAGGTGGVPPSVSDAVLARVSRLPQLSRRLLDLVALSPGRIERALLDACAPGWLVAAAEPEQIGIVDIGQNWVAFRHEIARQAVAAEIPAARRGELSRVLLDGLIERDADPARIVHHAEAVGDTEAVLRYGLAAARQATRYSANHEALAHLHRIAPLVDRIPAAERAVLFEQWSGTCVNTTNLDEAADVGRKALEIWTAAGDAPGMGRVARQLAHIHWALGYADEGDRYMAAARKAVSTLPRGLEVADVLAGHAARSMMFWRFDEALRWGREAIELAEEAGDTAVLAYALMVVGATEFALGGDLTVAERGLEVAKADGRHHTACILYANLAEVALERHDHGATLRYLDLGSEWADEHEVLSVLGYLTSLRSRVDVDRGRWTDAAALAHSVIAGPASTPINDLHALYSLARIAVRRGTSDAADAVATFTAAADRTGEPQRQVLAAMVRAEAADLAGALDLQRPALRELYEQITETSALWAVGEIALWLGRAGDPVDPPDGILEPIRLELAGNWTSAAAAWDRLGCPYEQADALAHSGDSDGLLAALQLFDSLGAEAAAARARELLRRHGVRQIPRGPRATTKANPAGLTARQVDVLALLAQGLTNAEIADQLVVSVRTVDHHVAAILAKLEVSSRRQAADLARQLGLGRADAAPVA